MRIRAFIVRTLLVVVPAFLVVQERTAVSATKENSNGEQVIRISASSFEFKPSEIVVKKGVPVTLELVSQDRHHGFKLAQFHLRAEIQAGVVEKVRFIPDKTGTFTFICDVFCGEGHEEMSGTLKVVEP